jgi:phosphate transport system substrate-binding protein
MIAISKKDGGPYVLPSITTVNDKTYAIARDLYMYTAGEASGAEKDYLDWIVSTDAQKVVEKLGFVPVLR